MIDLTQDALIKFLGKEDLDPTYQKETDQTYIKLTIKSHKVPLFFGIKSEGNLLQTIAYLPFQIPNKQYGEVARLLHILNRDFDVPGFGMDEKQGIIFYRCVIPCFEKKLDQRALNMYLGVTKIACETFMGAIQTILSGQVSVDKIQDA